MSQPKGKKFTKDPPSQSPPSKQNAFLKKPTGGNLNRA